MISNEIMENIISNVQKVVLETREKYKIKAFNQATRSFAATKFLRKRMLELGWEFAGEGWSKIVFKSSAHEDIVIKIVLFDAPEGLKEINLFEEIKCIKNKKHIDKFSKIITHSKHGDILVCKKLYKVDWRKIKFNKVHEFFCIFLKSIGFEELINDISPDNIMSKSNEINISNMVMCDLGYIGDLRKIKSKGKKI